MQNANFTSFFICSLKAWTFEVEFSSCYGTQRFTAM